MGNSPPVSTVQSVERAITVLEILAREGVVGVTEMAGELGVHKSTASRLLAALGTRELVEQEDGGGRYRLGRGIHRLANAAAAGLDLVQQSRPVTRRLAAEVGETVNVVVLADGEALYLDQVAGPFALRPHNWVGRRLPAHATSNGKVLLAHHPGQVRSLLRRDRLPAYTDQTITDPDALAAELRLVRERGYATAVDEYEPGLTAVAAPVRDAHGDVVASLSVSGPGVRLTAQRLDDLSATVRRAADELSWGLGWHGRRRLDGSSRPR